MPFFPPNQAANPVVQIPYDVKQFGAVGNGIADDTSAIQAAITASKAHAVSTWYFSIYFPQGTYKVTSPLTWEGGISVLGDGQGQSVITGSFNGFLFDEVDGGGSVSAGDTFNKVSILNTNNTADTSGCIRVSNAKVQLTVDQCFIQSTGGVGIRTHTGAPNGGGMFDIRLLSSYFLGGQGTSVGIMTDVAGGCLIAGCDFQSWGIAQQLSGLGITIKGGRSETNVITTKLGVAPNSTTIPAANASVSDHEYEANGITLYLHSVSNSTFSNISGSEMSEDSPPQLFGLYGCYIDSVTDCTFISCSMNAVFHNAGWRIVGDSTATFIRCQGGSSVSGVPGWDIQCDPNKLTFRDCNFSPPGSSGTPNLLPKAELSNGLGQIDYLSGTVSSANLSGTIAVPSASTHVDVVFPVAEDVSSLRVTAVGQSAGGSLTLLGSYRYLVTCVTRTGETDGNSTPGTVTLTGSNRTANLTLANTPGFANAYKKRVYRGTGLTTSDPYDGYWDMTSGNVTSFTDDGTRVFDGVKQPSNVITTTIGAPEADANYGVEVSMVWDSTYWISNVATTGFRINFHSAPGSDTSVKWFLYR